jgi:outer membrane protein assembly factor BamB
MSPAAFAVLALSLSAPAPKDGSAAPGDWPQWRGPSRDGVSLETGLLKTWPQDGPKLLWSFDQTGIGYSGFSVVGATLFTMGAEDEANGNREFVLAIDTTNGKERWRTQIGAFYKNGYGSGPRSTPTIDGDELYALGANGDLVCLNAVDGKKKWAKHLVKDFGGGLPGWGYSESVLIDGDKLIVTPGGNKGAIIALNKKNGEQVWRSEDLKDRAAYSSVIAAEVGGIKFYVQQTQKAGQGGGTCGVRASDGKLLWYVEDNGYRTAVIPTPIFYKDHVFVSAGYDAGCKLIRLSKDGDGIKADKVYANKVIVNHHGGLIRLGEYVYGHSDRGGWTCLDFLKSDKADGPEAASTFRFGKGSAVYADGSLYCLDEVRGGAKGAPPRAGVVIKVAPSPKAWREEGRFTLLKADDRRSGQGGVWTHPVIAHGKLYLRDQYNLFCYDVKGN